MDAFVTWTQANPSLVGFVVSAVIFLITLFLVARGTFGFLLTLLFLLFSLVAGLAISNQDIIREYMGKPLPNHQQTQDSHFKDQMTKSYEELKNQWEKMKSQLQTKPEDGKKEQPQSFPPSPAPEKEEKKS